MTVAAAVAELKLYLPDPTKRIRLRDLVMGEANRVHDAISDRNFPPKASTDPDSLRERVAKYEAATATLEALFATGCAFGDDPAPFADGLERVANSSDPWGGAEDLLMLRRYPALRCLYAGGIAAVHTQNWAAIKAMTYDRMFNDVHGPRRVALGVSVSPWEVFAPDKAGWLPDQERQLTPASNHLYKTLRPVFADLIPDDTRWQDTFDRFEYLLGLIFDDLQRQGHHGHFKSPVGCFGWRHNCWNPDEEHPVAGPLARLIDNATADTAPLQAGLFGGDLGRYRNIAHGYAEFVTLMSNRWH